MRSPRAFLLAGLALAWVLVGAMAPAPPARAQFGAVLADRDGWWNRAKGGDLPLTSPSLQFPVPDKAIAASASNGEPEKIAAVGIALDVDPTRFQRLILNIAEVTEPGANVGVAAGAAVDACLVTATWASTKNGEWPARPPFDKGSCVPGSRSSQGVWSFDVSGFARRWLAGEVAQNGVVLVEHVDAPVTFQVAWGDRTTSAITFSLDLTTVDEPAFAPIDTPTDTSSDTGPVSDGSTFDTVPSAPVTSSFEYSAGDSFSTPVAQPRAVKPRVASPPTTVAARRTAGTTRARLVAKKARLAGNIPLGLLLLLLPMGLGAAFAAAYALGPAGNPEGVSLVRREGGVSRALARRMQARPLEETR